LVGSRGNVTDATSLTGD